MEGNNASDVITHSVNRTLTNGDGSVGVYLCNWKRTIVCALHLSTVTEHALYQHLISNFEIVPSA